MSKKFLFLVCLFMLCISVNFVSAALTDSLVYYFRADEAGNTSLVNATGSYVLPEVGNVPNATGLINGSRGDTSTANYFENASSPLVVGNNTNVTYAFWINNVSAPSGTTALLSNINTGDHYEVIYYFTGNISFYVWKTTFVGATIPFTADGNWHFVVATWDGTNHNVSVWVDGIKGVDYTCPDSLSGNTEKLTLGTDDAHTHDPAFLFDEIGFWSRKLTQTEINELYNVGVGCTYPFTDCLVEPTSINFTATDDFNGSSIQSFSVNLTWNNGTLETRNTVTGTINFHNVSYDAHVVNVTYWNVTDYYPNTLYDLVVSANTTNDVSSGMFQAIGSFTATAKISNTSISGGVFYIDSKSGSLFNLSAGSHTVNFTHGNYYDLNGSSISVGALTNSTYTIPNVYSSIVNITVYYSNGTVLNDTSFGINITHNSYPLWNGEQLETSNGTAWFYLVNGTYTARLNSSEGNQTFTFVVDASTENIGFYYFGIDNCSDYHNTMLNITILKESDESLLDNSTLNIWLNATSTFIDTYYFFNFSFSIGNHYSLCVPDNTVSNWTINAQAEYSKLPTYVEKNYFFVNYPLNASPTYVNFYLTNNTAQITLQVRDYNDDAISDAYVSILSYDLGTNSYRTTEIVKTDSDGNAYAQVVQNTNWYAFLVSYDGAVILQTLPMKITTSTLTLRANLETDYFASYDVVQGVSSDLTFSNGTQTFSFTWNDPTGNVAQGCLHLTKKSINGETLLNTSCTTSSSATLLMSIPESVGTNTYAADGYLVIGGQNFAVQTLSVSFNNTYKTFGLSGIFFSMLLILTLVLVGLWHPVAAIVLMVVGVVATNVMGIFYMNWTYIITFIILAVITIYRVGKSD